MECWGASGTTNTLGGKGGYTKGNIILNANTIFYIYVGGCGIAPSSNKQYVTSPGGWNGGGSAIQNYNSDFFSLSCTSGGGATDIRTINGNWDNFNSLKSRIMVAGAGGGFYIDEHNHSTAYVTDTGGGAGGLIGLSGTKKEYGSGYSSSSLPTGGTQTSGGLGMYGWMASENSYFTEGNGRFGAGGDSPTQSGGGGAGYYGGGSGSCVSGSGGSSFISGHTGCNAISSSSTSTNIVHTGQPNHYSGYVFTNTVMKAGNESMPSPTGGTETGHSGNGYCKITWHPAL